MRVNVTGAALAAALLSSGCQQTARDGSRPIMQALSSEDAANTPIRPGGLRLRTPPPDRDKWASRRENRSGGGSATIYRCRDLACPSNAAVVIETRPSPTRKPDATALERLTNSMAAQARVELRPGSAASEIPQVDTLSSRVTRFKNYPAIFQEVRVLGNGGVVYSQLGLVFAGPVLIKVNAVSAERTVAKKSFDDFVAVMEIEEGPPQS